MFSIGFSLPEAQVRRPGQGPPFHLLWRWMASPFRTTQTIRSPLQASSRPNLIANQKTKERKVEREQDHLLRSAVLVLGIILGGGGGGSGAVTLKALAGMTQLVESQRTSG